MLTRMARMSSSRDEGLNTGYCSQGEMVEAPPLLQHLLPYLEPTPALNHSLLAPTFLAKGRTRLLGQAKQR